jgi:hypothetical protein
MIPENQQWKLRLTVYILELSVVLYLAISTFRKSDDDDDIFKNNPLKIK